MCASKTSPHIRVKKMDQASTNKLREIDQHITSKYEIAKRLGKGAYGIVWKGKSRRSGRKIVKHVPQQDLDTKMFQFFINFRAFFFTKA